jgi:ribosomal protein S18 acetylase RimI-like enzyme
MKELIKVGKSRGIEAFTLEVRVSNAPAVHIYEKLGFVSEGIRPNFYEKPREDAYIMWKRQ